MRVFRFGFALLVLLMSLPLLAQDRPLLWQGLPEGQTLLNLSVTERESVLQDTLTAHLRVETEERDAAALQSHINDVMEAALEKASRVSGLDVSTGRYAVHQYDRQPRGSRSDPVWRGSQTLVLETRSDPAALQSLIGELQADGFVISQLIYRLSDERADEVRDNLLEAAIDRLRQRAERAAAALGKNEVDIVELNIDTSGGGGPVMMRSMAMEADSTGSAVSAQAADTTVTLTVSGRVVVR